MAEDLRKSLESALGNTGIDNESTAIIPITAGEQQVRTKVFATKGQTTTILGLQPCTKLGLIQKGDYGHCMLANAVDCIAHAEKKRPKLLAV